MAETSTQIKVVLLGESGVGKTSLVQRFAYDQFKEHNAPTLGATFISKVLDLPGTGKAVKFQIWDTAGQEKYRSLAAMYYQDAAVALLVYDITNRDSFTQLNYWLGELKVRAPEKIKVAIAANKFDLVEQQVVDIEEAAKFAKEHHAIHQLTSAKEATGVRDLFIKIADLCMTSVPSQAKTATATATPAPDGKTQQLKAPTQTEGGKKKKKCC